jgi:arginase family enzyme
VKPASSSCFGRPGAWSTTTGTSNFRWRPDPDHPHAQNASVVVRVAGDVAAAVSEIAGQSRTPLVMGGDCTATVGVVAGLARSGTSPALLYVDGGPDLYTPETRAVGNLDAAPAFVLHLDVDVLAFIDTPLADVPDSGDEPIGLTLDELVTSLTTFVASPRLAALVLTEVNPDHVPDAAVLRHFVERLTATLAGA